MEISDSDYLELCEFRKIKGWSAYANNYYKEFVQNMFISEFHENCALPIVFTKERIEGKEENCLGCVRSIGVEDKGFVIEIRYGVYEEYIMVTIRHEIIHYVLNVLNLEASDYSALFHILCELCDANAYSGMSIFQERLFDGCYEIIKDLYNLSKEDEDRVIKMSLKIMFQIIGDKVVVSNEKVEAIRLAIIKEKKDLLNYLELRHRL